PFHCAESCHLSRLTVSTAVLQRRLYNGIQESQGLGNTVEERVTKGCGQYQRAFDGGRKIRQTLFGLCRDLQAKHHSHQQRDALNSSHCCCRRKPRTVRCVALRISKKYSPSLSSGSSRCSSCAPWGKCSSW